NTVDAALKLTGPATIGSDAGTLTLNGNIDMSNGTITFTGAGDINVKGTMTSKAIGLLEGQANASNSPTAPIDPRFGTDIQLGTTMAQSHSVIDVTTPFATTQHTWSSVDTWIYTGTIFFPNDPLTPGSGSFTFAEDNDDSGFLKIDGVTYISDTDWTK